MKKVTDFIKQHKVICSCVVILALLVASVLLFGWLGVWYCLLLAAIVGIALTGLKQHGMLKIIGIILLLLILVSNVLPGRGENLYRIGLLDTELNYLSIVLQNFSYIFLYVLAIGGFYGVLSKVPSYKKLLDNIVTKVKPQGKRFVYITALIFAVVASLTGMTMPLFIFVPFVVTIIMLLGYDKLVAFSATFVSIVVGYMGGVFVSFLDPNTYSMSTYEEFVGVEEKLANTFPKLLLLFAGVALLIYFMSKHIKNVEAKKVKYELTDNSELLVTEVKGNYKDIKTWPLVVILSLLFVIIVLGMVPWNTLFGIDVFKKFHEWLIALSINKIPVIPTILSSNLQAFGEWNMGSNILASYVHLTLVLTITTVIISLVSKMKLNETIDNYLDGMKKVFPTALLLTISFTVLVFAYNNGFIEGVISGYGKFNYGVSSLLAFLGCIINVDLIWILIGIFTPITKLITDESIYSSVALLFQGIYSIFMLVGPTSIFLILGLSYFDIPYTTWLKYIWRFILALVVLLALVTLLVILI